MQYFHIIFIWYEIKNLDLWWTPCYKWHLILFGDIIDIGDVGAESRKEMADLDEAMSLAAEKSKMYSDTIT